MEFILLFTIKVITLLYYMLIAMPSPLHLEIQFLAVNPLLIPAESVANFPDFWLVYSAQLNIDPAG